MNSEKLKSYFWILLDVLLAGVIFNLVFFVMPAVKKYGDSLFPVRTMTVSAEGKAKVAPDMAEFSFSVISQGENPDEIAEVNNEKVNAAIEFVKGEGIGEEDIKTTGYNLSPNYEYDSDTQSNFIAGYTLTQTVSVRVKNLEDNLSKVSKILGGLPSLGINQISEIGFSIENPESVLEEARAKAIINAREKAARIAKESGARLGEIISVSEYQGQLPIRYYAAAKDKIAGGVEITPPTIEPGTQQVTVNVSITYSLR